MTAGRADVLRSPVTLATLASGQGKDGLNPPLTDAVKLRLPGSGTTIAPLRYAMAGGTSIDGAGIAAPLTPGRGVTDAHSGRRPSVPRPVTPRLELSPAHQVAAREVPAVGRGLLLDPLGLVSPARSGAVRTLLRAAGRAHRASRHGRSTGTLEAREHDPHRARMGVRQGHTSRATPGPGRETATPVEPATAGPPIELRTQAGGPATVGPAIELRTQEGGPATVASPIELRTQAGGPATVGPAIELRSPREYPGEIRSEEQRDPGAGRDSIEAPARAAPPEVVLLPTVTTGGMAADLISDALPAETRPSAPLSGAAHAKYQTEKCRPDGAA
jgi:hypothetical protein